MAALDWSDHLLLELPAMDDTHREFVDLLARVEDAGDDTLLAAWAALVAHTVTHFGQEDAWMLETGFASGNCHSTQHRIVLQVMEEGLKRADFAIIRQLARELAIWFPQHAQSMDAALALHLRNVGFDPETGVLTLPAALPTSLIHGCGGSICSDATASLESA